VCPLRPKFGEVMKTLGASWQSMSDAEKEPYMTKAANFRREDALVADEETKRARNAWMHFVAENRALYKELPPMHVFKALGGVWRGMSDAEKEQYMTKTTAKQHNARMHFLTESRALYKELPPKHISRALAAVWCGMSKAEREPYVTKAANDKKYFEDALAAFEEEGGVMQTKAGRARTGITGWKIFMRERFGAARGSMSNAEKEPHASKAADDKEQFEDVLAALEEGGVVQTKAKITNTTNEKEPEVPRAPSAYISPMKELVLGSPAR